MVEVADPGQPSEAGRLAQKSTEQFRAGQIDKAQEYAGDSALAAAYTLLQQIVGVMAFLLPPVLFFGNWALTQHSCPKVQSERPFCPPDSSCAGRNRLPRRSISHSRLEI